MTPDGFRYLRAGICGAHAGRLKCDAHSADHAPTDEIFAALAG